MATLHTHSRSARSAVPVPMPLTPATMAGLWTLRFGLFGCRDDETHGGILHVEGHRMAGGDGQLIFHGEFAIDGPTTLAASLQVVRHGGGLDYRGVFGALAPLFRLDVAAEAITPDLFEGRIGRMDAPNIRVVMRRFEPITERSRIV
jgi:hypothetical protein